MAEDRHLPLPNLCYDYEVLNRSEARELKTARGKFQKRVHAKLS